MRKSIFLFLLILKFLFSKEQIIPIILIPYSEQKPNINGVIEEK